MDLTSEREYVELADQIATLEAQLKGLKECRDALEAALLERWLDAGLDNLSVNGRKVYTLTRTFAQTPLGKPAAVALLKANPEHGALVEETVNGNRLNALVAELMRDNGNLPPEWKGVIEAYHKPYLRVSATNSQNGDSES